MPNNFACIKKNVEKKKSIQMWIQINIRMERKEEEEWKSKSNIYLPVCGATTMFYILFGDSRTKKNEKKAKYIRVSRHSYATTKEKQRSIHSFNSFYLVVLTKTKKNCKQKKKKMRIETRALFTAKDLYFYFSLFLNCKIFFVLYIFFTL